MYILYMYIGTVYIYIYIYTVPIYIYMHILYIYVNSRAQFSLCMKLLKIFDYYY